MTTPAQDARYLTDAAKVDSGLNTYVQLRGNVALKAMLTDGTAFFRAFLKRGGGIDAALLDVVTGAKSVESQTHFPANDTAFNTVEALALLILCPSEQRLVPRSVVNKIHKLNKALGTPPSSTQITAP